MIRQLIYSTMKYFIVSVGIVLFFALQFTNAKDELKSAARHTLMFGGIGTIAVLLLLFTRKVEFQTNGNILVKYNGTASEVTIPAGITEIGRLAFQDCDSITKITIPNGVKLIREGAFANCTNLETVEIPQTVEWIEARAFAYDFKLENVSLPDVLKELDDELFYGCESLRNVNIGKKVEWIGNYAFYQCKRLEDITIPPNVKSIGNSSFSGCESLHDVSLPQSSFDIGINAFANCKSLKEITLPSKMTYVNTGAFWNCISLETVELPEHATSIGDRAFYKCISLKKCDLPDDLMYIGNEAFYECTSLENITLPSTIYIYRTVSDSKSDVDKRESAGRCWIGADCFSGCIQLSNVYIPEHVTISPTAFYGCTSLRKLEVAENHSLYKTVGNVLYSKSGTQLIIYPSGLKQTTFTIPDSVRSIEEKAFSGNSHIRSVIAGSRLRTIGNGAFCNCKGLKTIELDEKLETISEEAFSGCSSLEQINIPKMCKFDVSAFYECASLKNILVNPYNENYRSKNGVLFDIKYQTLLLYPAGKGEECYEVPQSVKTIAKYAFAGNTNLTEIVLPDGVSEIEYRAFSKCTSLKMISMTDSIEIMASEIFYGIENQVSLTIQAETKKCIPIIYAENVGIEYDWIKQGF